MTHRIKYALKMNKYFFSSPQKFVEEINKNEGFKITQMIVAGVLVIVVRGIINKEFHMSYFINYIISIPIFSLFIFLLTKLGQGKCSFQNIMDVSVYTHMMSTIVNRMNTEWMIGITIYGILHCYNAYILFLLMRSVFGCDKEKQEVFFISMIALTVLGMTFKFFRLYEARLFYMHRMIIL